MLPPSKLSIISLSSFETKASLHNNQFISYYHNTNNNRDYFIEKQLVNTKSFHKTLDQAVEYFEQILNQCTTTSSNAPLLIRNNDPQERDNIIKSQLELKKRDHEDLLRSISKKENFKRKPKINCRKWCEEQNRRITKYADSIDNTDWTYHSRNQRNLGSIFFCRKALLQKPDGTTYICIRKRLN